MPFWWYLSSSSCRNHPPKLLNFSPQVLFVLMDASALVPTNLDSLELQGSAGSVTNKTNLLGKELPFLPNLTG